MKTDRLISIIMILLDKKRIRAQTLADMFSVSKRTIYRDIDTINMAGIPICAISGVSGGFEIMENYKIGNKVFSTTDISAILTALSGLSDMMKGNEIVNTLAKVKSLIPADRVQEIELKSTQLRIDLNPWIGNRNIMPYIRIIQASLNEHRLITFEYDGLHDEKCLRQAEPYQLILKNSRWYLYAFCRVRNDFRLFKLSRMIGLQIINETFTPRQCPDPLLDATEITETMQITVKLRIHKSITDRILDFCPFENFANDGTDNYIVTFPFIPNDYYYYMLLSFGDRCECLEPQNVRAELKLRIQKLEALYTRLI